MRYRYFGSELLLLELVNAQTASGSLIPTASATQAKRPAKVSSRKAVKSSGDKSQQERLELASPELLKLYDTVCSYIEQLGDEVQRKELKLYTAFKRIRNFVSVLVMPGKDTRLVIYLKLPGSLGEENSFSRDMSSIGHWGTGDLEVNIRTAEDWEKARQLVDQAYQQS